MIDPISFHNAEPLRDENINPAKDGALKAFFSAPLGGEHQERDRL